MSNTWINLSVLWRIVVFGLLLGAGLPALFAIGLRLLSTARHGGEAAAEGSAADSGPTANPVSRIVAGLCFAAVLAAIGWGIYSIVNHS
ncbi:hypothetical protein KDL01_25780 [Actinospica durhamensis]|uniref:Uncharacterized protein n=1 Tax=Actinospica durhamensis TaxID=1508375 RepID=A0A941ERK5_9ACTN|nr:hypothetical protein [Actinospica durhamensis]MBR7836717.1 hypothetical protein [Actinospica durhamensis]